PRAHRGIARRGRRQPRRTPLMPVSGSTARRYAEAMLSFAQDERTVQQFRASLDRLGAAFDRTTVLALTNPAVPLARRDAAVAAATKDEPVEVRSLMRPPTAAAA